MDRIRVHTGVASIREVIKSISGTKKMVIEEGPMAHWLWRNLRDDVDEFMICDPRRNALIAKEGDKDDAIDAGKLAELYRGGFVREVYHSDNERRVELKRWVMMYHDRVAQRVREINKIYGQCRHYGLRYPPMRLLQPDVREQWFQECCPEPLQAMLEITLPGLAMADQQVRATRKEVIRGFKPYSIIDDWQAIPGIGPIRAVTFFVFVDIPWRFKTKEKLFKYCGLGLRRRASGTDKQGRMRNHAIGLERYCNKTLKDMAMGAALAAVRQGANPFADKYDQSIKQGATQKNALHTVARKLLAVMWSMWKTSRPYEPTYVCGMN